MSNTINVSLANFEEIKKYLPTERAAIVSHGTISDSQELVRSVEEAEKILNHIENIQKTIFKCLSDNPSLESIFEEQFISFIEFSDQKTIYDLCFLDTTLFPEQVDFTFATEDSVEFDTLIEFEKFFKDWAIEHELNHKKTQILIREEFEDEIQIKELECHCQSCVADYRTKLRESIYNYSKELILSSYEEIDEQVNNGLNYVSDIFYTMQKSIDKKFQKIRHRLRRATINKLESQIKHLIKDKYRYPSDLAIKHIEINLNPFCVAYLRSQGLRADLISSDEYDRYYAQVSTNIWRNERYHEREFKKFIKSILFLKRKDISANILKEHLGEFWSHSSARQIKRKIVYHMGPTNSGKTYHAIEALKQAEKGCYLAPLRLLASELYDTLNLADVKTSLLTGEEVIEVEGATHYSSTIEMAKLSSVFDCVVIDEIQMITDPQRGWAWTRALVNIFSPEIHICGDPSVLSLIEEIVNLCGDELEIKTYERMTELNLENRALKLEELQKSDALIVFSRRNALKHKHLLEQNGFRVSIIYGMLSPEVRREQARKFDEGETDIIVSTDAISMGMNLPIRRIVFSTLSKFINSVEYIITDSEIKQIAGRAGRYKRYPIGYVNYIEGIEGGHEKIKRAINIELKQKERCMVGPDLDIFAQVNTALEKNNLPLLKLSDFLRLFNTMQFKDPFYCVQLKEMIEVAEMVEDIDSESVLNTGEIFGFSCAPVNLGLSDHVQYFMWILGHYVRGESVKYSPIDFKSNDIDYLETSIKCMELYQWLSRHFGKKLFDFNEVELLHNKGLAVEKLNELLSEKFVPKFMKKGFRHNRGNRKGSYSKSRNDRDKNENSSFSRKKSGFKKKGFKKKGFKKKGFKKSGFKKKSFGSKSSKSKK